MSPFPPKRGKCVSQEKQTRYWKVSLLVSRFCFEGFEGLRYYVIPLFRYFEISGFRDYVISGLRIFGGFGFFFLFSDASCLFLHQHPADDGGTDEGCDGIDGQSTLHAWHAGQQVTEQGHRTTGSHSSR